MEQPLGSKVIVNLALQSEILDRNLPLHKKKKEEKNITHKFSRVRN
jgi:hypothetical protein